VAAFSLFHRRRPAQTGASPQPAVVLLHGLGDDESGLFVLASQLDPRLEVVSVRAPLAHRYGGYAWFDLEQHGYGLGSASIERALVQLHAFIDEISASYPIDPARLYCGGFSMGAAMAGAMALLHPDRIAGAIMVSGFLPPGNLTRYRVSEAAGHPFFVAHGVHDPVVPVSAARMTRDFLQTTGVDLTYREYPIGHTVTADEVAELAVWFVGVLDQELRPVE
jgi:phospholipase/carboxylesterase